MSSSTSPGLVIPSSVSRSKHQKEKKKNRNLQRKRENLKVMEVEAHPRNLNNNHVTIDLDCDLATCNPNMSVTNDVSRTSLSFNASCVFCRKSMLSGDHSKCVATSLLTRLKKLTKGKKSRPTTASKSKLGLTPPVVSKDVVATPLVEPNNPKNLPLLSDFTKSKARSSWKWQRWLTKMHNFAWIPKGVISCASNQPEPTTSSGSTLTRVPSSSPSCDAGGANHSLDC